MLRSKPLKQTGADTAFRLNASATGGPRQVTSPVSGSRQLTGKKTGEKECYRCGYHGHNPSSCGQDNQHGCIRYPDNGCLLPTLINVTFGYQASA